MAKYASYIICGTPRSGSTLLCEMLAASGLAGRPNSYFRQQDIGDWADHWGIPRHAGTDTEKFDSLYLDAMRNYGQNDTGVFGLRVMWGNVEEMKKRLSRVLANASDIPALLEAAFGSTLYVHLSRHDKLAQAISLLRAEQSGLWHLASDGSIMEGTSSPKPNVYDGQRLQALVGELHSADTRWNDFFQSREIEPLRLTYETVTADPQSALAVVLIAIGQDSAIAKKVSTKTARMANGINVEWAERFRSENPLA